MTVKYQDLIKLAFVSFLLVFVSCSKGDSDQDDNRENQYHSYQLEFEYESGTNTTKFTYGASETQPNLIGQFKKEESSYGALTLDFKHDTDHLTGTFRLDGNEAPIELDFDRVELQFLDSGLNRTFKSVSGTLKISELNILKTSDVVSAASYILDFDGSFELTDANGEVVLCEGKGTVKVGQSMP